MRSYNTFSMEQRITNLEEKVKEGGGGGGENVNASDVKYVPPENHHIASGDNVQSVIEQLDLGVHNAMNRSGYDIFYNNFASGLRANNVQSAIDEVNSKISQGGGGGQGGEQSYPELEQNSFYKVAERSSKIVFEGFVILFPTDVVMGANTGDFESFASTTPGYPNVYFDEIYKIEGTWREDYHGVVKPINVPSDTEPWVEVYAQTLSNGARIRVTSVAHNFPDGAFPSADVFVTFDGDA